MSELFFSWWTDAGPHYSFWSPLLHLWVLWHWSWSHYQASIAFINITKLYKNTLVKPSRERYTCTWDVRRGLFWVLKKDFLRRYIEEMLYICNSGRETCGVQTCQNILSVLGGVGFFLISTEVEIGALHL